MLTEENKNKQTNKHVLRGEGLLLFIKQLMFVFVYKQEMKVYEIYDYLSDALKFQQKFKIHSR